MMTFNVPTTPLVPFSNLLVTAFFKRSNNLNIYHAWGVTDVLCHIKHVLCQPQTLFETFHLKTIDLGTMEPEVVSDTPVQVQPMAGHVQTHAELKQESVGRVHLCQIHQQTHRGTTVSQHVQHGTKLCT